MLRFLLRACGFVCVAAAFAALVVDGSRSIAGGRLLQYPLGDALGAMLGARFPPALAAVAAWPAPARLAASGLLAAPGWAVAAAAGAALLYAGRRPARGAPISRRRT